MHLLSQKIAEVCAKRARRKEARPAELLAAALDLFVEKGFAATRAEEVASRAGVSKGTLFLYYKSKEELFKAVVRETIGGSRYTEWNAELESFEGTTAELLRYGMNSWWARVGETKASGLTKLMMCEAQNFPELATFYEQEVIEPGHDLIRRILQRGIDRGEFRPINVDYGVYTVLAPLIFLTLSRHAMGSCISRKAMVQADVYIATQIDTILHGLCVPSLPSSSVRLEANSI
jgi:TetR/AcrR family transcriptional regulator